MNIIVIGAGGTIGKQVSIELAKRHEVVTAGRSDGNVTVDISDPESIKEMYEGAEDLDAVVCVAGEAKWESLSNLSEDDFYVGIRSKLMGQVNLVKIGMDYLNKGGSFTLTTGILAEDPVLNTTSAAMVNGALHSFVKAAALELDNGLRINAVASGMVDASADKYRNLFPGHIPVPMERVLAAYVRSVDGRGNGGIIRVYG